MKASGTFEVQLSPIEYSHPSKDELQLGRLSINKTFSGDLNATSRGEMLSARSSQPGMAGYVAIEQVSGSLMGKSGSFALQHYGTMNGEDSKLVLEVVPGSGSNELKNISGSMTIKIEDGKHFYAFDYKLD